MYTYIDKHISGTTLQDKKPRKKKLFKKKKNARAIQNLVNSTQPEILKSIWLILFFFALLPRLAVGEFFNIHLFVQRNGYCNAIKSESCLSGIVFSGDTYKHIRLTQLPFRHSSIALHELFIYIICLFDFLFHVSFLLPITYFVIC